MNNKTLFFFIMLALFFISFKKREKFSNVNYLDKYKYLFWKSRNRCFHPKCKKQINNSFYKPLERIGHIKLIGTKKYYQLYQSRIPYDSTKNTYYYLDGNKWEKYFKHIEKINWLNDNDLVRINGKKYKATIWDISSPNRYYMMPLNSFLNRRYLNNPVNKYAPYKLIY